jgi:hypothetical protein
MSKKKAFVLRIDPEKLQSIEKWASDEFRSTNGQLEYIIDQALKRAGRVRKKREGGVDTASDNTSKPDS